MCVVQKVKFCTVCCAVLYDEQVRVCVYSRLLEHNTLSAHISLPLCLSLTLLRSPSDLKQIKELKKMPGVWPLEFEASKSGNQVRVL